MVMILNLISSPFLLERKIMKYKNLIIFFLAFTMSFFSKANDSSTVDAVVAMDNLKNFRFKYLNNTNPPCFSLECYLIWGAAAAALGDIGEYARRVGVEGMPDYAKSIGVNQNFPLLKQIENLPVAMPYHISNNFSIDIKNIIEIRQNNINHANGSLESRPIISSKINGIPFDLIFDTGATLTIPSSSMVATTLDTFPFKIYSTSGLGGIAMGVLSTAKKVVIGDSEISNITVNLSSQSFSHSESGSPIGLIGYDLLMRFDAVMINLIDGVIEFNPSIEKYNYCTAMTLAIDENKIPAGISIAIDIGEVSAKARLDTGGNFDVLLHGNDILKGIKFSPSNIKLVDEAGHFHDSSYSIADISVGKNTSSHVISRTSEQHSDFEITLGAKFFSGRIVILDFLHQKMCFY